MLADITGPQDVKALPEEQLPALCAEIRSTLLDYGRRHGGHIGSNLGMVEATVALHRVFDSPRDRIVFDVSHQAYVHKMLTGRAQAYLDPACADEVTGFTNPRESEHDQFVLGHTGVSISLALGLAKTRDMARAAGKADDAGDVGDVVAVIGDGALSSGIAFEGLNNAGEQGTGLIIVLNDNEMSIAGDFGGMYGPLGQLRRSGGSEGVNLFHAFGLDYRYVEDGNDVIALTRAFEQVRGIDHPMVVHIHTIKGLGLGDAHAETATGAHGVGDATADGCDLTDRAPHEGRCEANHWLNPAAAAPSVDPRKHYGAMAMAAFESRFDAEPGLVVISPATPGSNGITRAWRERAGAHYVDVGITEQHALAYAAGIAKAGGMPVVATTASFFQRAYDQFIEELALNAQPVTVLVFLSGLSGTDATHSGACDIAMLSNIPGLTCLAPTGGEELLADLAWATDPARRHSDVPGPVIIRMPGERILARDLARSHTEEERSPERSLSAPLSWRVTQSGADVALLALGDTHPLAEEAAALLRERTGLEATIVDPRQYSLLDEAALDDLRAHHRVIVTLEDGQLDGGWGQRVAAWFANHADADPARNPRVLTVGGAKEFTDRVPLPKLNARYGLTAESIVTRVEEALAFPACGA